MRTPLHLLLALSAAASAQLVKTSIAFSKSSFNSADQVTMTFKIQNTGSTSVSYCTWNTPIGAIAGDVLDVSTVAGRAKYVGPLVKRGPLTSADYITLAPGEAVTKDVDLSMFYDLSKPGTYTAKFVAPSTTPSNAGATPKTVQPIDLGSPSVPATFAAPSGIPAKTPASKSAPAAKGVNTPSCSGCSSTRTADLLAAYSAAASMSWNAADTLLQTPNTTRPNASRSKTYFGAYDFSRYRLAANFLENIRRTLRDEAVVFTDVSGNTSDPHHTAFAYVYPSDPYRVYLGSAFWTAPLTGEDSKAGTLIHELSHFTVIGGSSDHITPAFPNGTYGRANCMNMASTDPASAVMHADCIEYFSENPTTIAQGTDKKVRADFNDDGNADLGYFEPGNNSFYTAMSNGSHFIFGGQWTSPNSFGGNKDQFYIGDFNGDGLPDLGFFEIGNNTFYVAINTGSGFGGPGTGAWTAPNSFGSGTGRFLVGDFNGDGRSDIAYFDPTNNTVSVSASSGTSFNDLHSGVWVGTNQFGWQAANFFVGDFNGDRIADLGYAENNNTFHVNLSVGTGFFGTGSGMWVNNNFGGPWGKYYIGDFNGDGKSDLGFFEPGTNSFHVTTSTGTGFFGANSGAWSVNGAFGTDKTRFLVGDFNGDGADDLAYQVTSNNSVKVGLSTKTGFATPSTWVNPSAFGGSTGNYFIGQSN